MKNTITLLNVLILVSAVSLPLWATDIGPDTFGYIATDNVSSNWYEMSTGTQLSLGDDDMSFSIPLGFTFFFYGSPYDSVYVTSNGQLLFELIEYNSFQGSQCPLPSPGTVDAMVAFYHRDFNTSDPSCTGDCGIYWHSGGTAGERWFGVTYEQVPQYFESPDVPDPVTVQVVLFENSNQILVQVEDAGTSEGGDATIGIEAPDGFAGLSWPGCLTSGSIIDNKAILFSPPAGGTVIVPAESVGIGLAGATVEHSFQVFNLEATGTVFDLAASGFTWVTSLDPTSLPLDAGGSGEFSVNVTISGSASGGDGDTATVALTPQAGGDPLSVTTATLVQDPPDSWMNVSAMVEFMEHPLAEGVGNDLWLAGGGVYDELSGQLLATSYMQVMHLGGDELIWEFSYACPASATWDAALECCYDESATNCVAEESGSLQPMPQARFSHKGCAADGKLFIAGGQGGEDLGGSYADTLFIYNTRNDTWQSGAAMPLERLDHVVVCDAARDLVFVIGGRGNDDVAQNTLWAYDYSADVWNTALANMPTARVFASAELIDPDTILVAGGLSEGGSQRSDLYDIVSDTWTRTGDLPNKRFYNASAIYDGRMCLIGGLYGGSSSWDDDTFECYSGGYWVRQISTLNQGRSFCEGATITDGMFVVGGMELMSNPDTPAKFIERYPTGSLLNWSLFSDGFESGDVSAWSLASN